MRLNHLRLREATALTHEEAAQITDEIKRLLAEVAAWRKTFPAYQYNIVLDSILLVEPSPRAPPAPQG